MRAVLITLVAAGAGVAAWVLLSSSGTGPDLGGRRGLDGQGDPVIARDDGPGTVSTRQFTDPRTPVAVPIGQRLLIERVAEILGDETPEALRTRVFPAEWIQRVAKRVEEAHRDALAVRTRFQKRARARAEVVFERGGYREWEAKRIRVPDPDHPAGGMVDRLSTPYDGQRDDEFILAKAAPHPTRRLRHVVRLVPEGDPEYAGIYQDRLDEEAALRAELRTWLLEQL